MNPIDKQIAEIEIGREWKNWKEDDYDGEFPMFADWGESIGIYYSEDALEIYSPSTDWEQGGPLIEKYKIDLGPHENGIDWVAQTERWMHSTGKTPLEAVCKAIIASKERT